MYKSPRCLPTKFQVSWPFGSGEEAKNRFSGWLPRLPIELQVKWPFGSMEEAKNRFSRWQPSWISDQKDFSYFWSTSYLDASYQVSSQLAFWFKRGNLYIYREVRKSGAFHIPTKKNRVSHFVEKRGLIIYLAALKKGAIRHAHPYYAIYRKLPSPENRCLNTVASRSRFPLVVNSLIDSVSMTMPGLAEWGIVKTLIKLIYMRLFNSFSKLWSWYYM